MFWLEPKACQKKTKPVICLAPRHVVSLGEVVGFQARQHRSSHRRDAADVEGVESGHCSVYGGNWSPRQDEGTVHDLLRIVTMNNPEHEYYL